MFCRNCGNQVGEGERFCSKCGTEILAEKKENLCPHCHVPVEEEAKFCNKCGTALTASTTKICPFCGKPMETGESFCKFCEKRSGGSKLIDLIDKFIQWVHKISDGKVTLSKYFGSTAESYVSLRMKHLIIGCALAVLALFCFLIPVVEVEVPILSFFSNDGSKTIHISLIGLMMADGEAAETLGLEGIAGMFAFLSFLEMLVLAGAAFYTLRPAFNGQIIKRRMFVLPFYAVISSFIGMMSQISIFQTACDRINREFDVQLASTSISFFGALSILIHIVVFVMLLVVANQNKKIVRKLSGGLI